MSEWESGRMNEWANEWVSEWAREWEGAWVSEWVSERECDRLGGSMKKWVDKWMCAWLQYLHRERWWFSPPNACLYEWWGQFESSHKWPGYCRRKIFSNSSVNWSIVVRSSGRFLVTKAIRRRAFAKFTRQHFWYTESNAAKHLSVAPQKPSKRSSNCVRDTVKMGYVTMRG